MWHETQNEDKTASAMKSGSQVVEQVFHGLQLLAKRNHHVHISGRNLAVVSICFIGGASAGNNSTTFVVAAPTGSLCTDGFPSSCGGGFRTVCGVTGTTADLLAILTTTVPTERVL